MNDTYQVTATLLNLRSAPAINPNNIIGRLGQGEVVEKLSEPRSSWFEVKTHTATGFAAASFLTRVGTPAVAPPTPAGFLPPQAFFAPNPRSVLSSTDMRHCRIDGLAVRPRGVPQATRISDLHTIVALLDVQRSLRYQRTPKSTYCNIYACDFCFIADVYLPRVWWMEKALVEIGRGSADRVRQERSGAQRQ